MDIHKPKPFHNWREFLKEYAIIVLGVATALAAEQAVVTLHDRARAAEARAAIRAEIALNVGRMNVRQAVESCIGKRLDEVDGLIAASAAGKLPQEVLWIGATPAALVIFDSTYKAAMQSGTASLFSYGEQQDYANLYASFENYNRAVAEEARSWGDLRTLERHPAPSAMLDWQLRSAMQQARIARAAINTARYWALRDSATIGVTPARLEPIKMPTPCIPLHTPREEALKLGNSGIRGIPVP
ncbi:MAG: hypothetical protein JO256_05230 [Alphaproteobacteria bacterium]|nr:hypothetical protein [Alphaproteobacteria bacterium]